MSKTAGAGRAKRPARARRRTANPGEFSRRQFDRLVAEAMEEIPEPFRSRLENVALVVDDEPDPELLDSLGMSRHDTLLGLYDGIPLTERGDWYNLVPPDRILIFRRPIMSICSSPAEIRAEVRQTILHEVAHFYGIDDDELRRMGFS